MRSLRHYIFLTIALLASALPGSARERWALCVGVNDYQKVNHLKGCQNDARLMAHLLEQNCGFAPDHVRVLDQALSTRAGIEQAFLDQLGVKPGPDDLVVFSFSGHGTQFSTATGEVHEAICPLDIDPANLSTLITDSDLSRWITRVRAAQVVVILDSCHSGSQVKSIGKRSQAKYIRMSVGAPRSINQAKSIEGSGKTVLLAACQAQETAQDCELPQGSAHFQGAFTYALAQVLGGAAPEASARLTYEDLLDRIHRVLRDDLQEAQTPVLQGSYQGSTLFQGPLAHNRPPQQNLPQVQGAYGLRVGVAVEAFPGDTVEAARAIRSRLAACPSVTVTSLERATLVVQGKVSGGRVQAGVYLPSGTMVNTFQTASAAEAAGLVEGEVRRYYNFGWLARLQNPGASFHVQLACDRGDGASYKIGQNVTFTVRADHDCYLTLIDVGTSGALTLLFPGRFVRAGEALSIPDASMRADGISIQVQGPKGREMVKALATTRPVDLSALAPSCRDALAFRAAMNQVVARDLVLRERTPDLDWAEASTVLFVK